MRIWLLLALMVSLYGQSITEVTAYYPAFCQRVVEDEALFWKFRGEGDCQRMVENVTYEQGRELALFLEKDYPHLLERLFPILAEDPFGKPVAYEYPSIGLISPATLRYVKIGGDLNKEFGDLAPFRILEIGGGYGGQCKILHNLFGFQSYTILDLPQVIPLIQKYLRAFGIPHVSYREEGKYDLLISNYAFSEIGREEQIAYFEPVIRHIPRGYITYNSASDYYEVDSLSVEELVSLLVREGREVKVEPEHPNTGTGNVTIIWHPQRLSVSFDASMQMSYCYDAEEMERDAHWQIFRSDFETYRENFCLQEEYLIPKRIHFIWLGSPLPAKYEKWILSWKQMHPDWTIQIWTDDDVEGFGLRNQLAFDFAENYGEKSDIFRYEILYRYGGLYVDTDFECVKPFDAVHRSCTFYAGVAYDREALLYNGLIGARAGHPILKACVENLQIGPGNHDPFRIMKMTGPYFFSEMYFQTQLERGVPFPVTYLYPFPNRHADGDPEKYMQTESMAIHYWESSWAK